MNRNLVICQHPNLVIQGIVRACLVICICATVLVMSYMQTTYIRLTPAEPVQSIMPKPTKLSIDFTGRRSSSPEAKRRRSWEEAEDVSPEPPQAFDVKSYYQAEWGPETTLKNGQFSSKTLQNQSYEASRRPIHANGSPQTNP